MKKLCNLKISSKTVGNIAEGLCRIYMRCLGYRIVAKNYRCGTGKKTPYGELDFIAIRGKNLVFCEVKKRNNDRDFLRALSPQQQHRIIRGGQYFLQKNPKYRQCIVQYDVFFVRFPWYIKRIENALYCDKSIY